MGVQRRDRSEAPPLALGRPEPACSHGFPARARPGHQAGLCSRSGGLGEAWDWPAQCPHCRSSAGLLHTWGTPTLPLRDRLGPACSPH